jgi:DNA-binding NtrC family response regulator
MSEQQQAAPQSLPPTILVVDDEPSITKLCKAILQRAGFSVLTAEGSSEALKICTHHEGPIDLLLTDIVIPPPAFQLASSANQFPHVHGHELAVRALGIRSNLRVILMSGKIDQDLEGYGLHRKSLPALSKPFEPQSLVALVRQTIHASPPSAESLAEDRPGIPNVGDGWFD